MQDTVMPDGCGLVYKATSRTSGKCYVGQTINFPVRQGKHKYNSEIGKDTYFYRAIRKYGWDDFEWEILDDFIPVDHLDAYEDFYIHYHKAHISEGGYNLEWGPSEKGVTRFYKHTEDTRRKMSMLQKGKPKLKQRSIEHRRNLSKVTTGIKNHSYGKPANNRQKVLCITTNQIYDSIELAAKDLNLNRQCIGQVCLGHRKSTGGYKFEYYRQDENDKG